jgi:hypothetical protein
VSNAFGTARNTPEQVIVNPADVSLGLYPGVTLNGTVGYSYIIQSTTDLSNTNSSVMMTNVVLVQPVQLWVDTNLDASLPTHTPVLLGFTRPVKTAPSAFKGKRRATGGVL